LAKIPASTKTRITKLFKQGKSIPEIKAAVIDKFPKITPERIRVVVKHHLEGLCDELWSKAVKLQDGNKCVISKKTDNLNSHHLIGRKNRNFRWDLMNGVTLSPDHHTLGNNISAHGSTDVTQRFAEWMVWAREDQWKWFQENKNIKTVCKVDIFGLLEVSKRLQAEIDDMTI